MEIKGWTVFTSIVLSAQFVASIVFAHEDYQEYYDFVPHYFPGVGVSLTKELPGDLLSFESLLKDQNQFRDTDSFLQYLKRRAPEIFKRPVLLHSTGSLQHATPDNPRVLLFGRGSVFSFDSPDGEAGSRVEMIEFDYDTKTFSMREIAFSKEGGATFDAKPTACVACHGDDPKPLWSPYDLWPKAYGAGASSFRSQTEVEKYNRFVQVNSDRSIYQYLEELPRLGSTSTLKLDSNDAFTQFIETLSNLRMRDALRNKKELHPFRYAIAGAFGACHGGHGVPSVFRVEEFLPKEIIEAFTQPRNDFFQDVVKSRAAFLTYNKKLYARLHDGAELDIEISRRLDFENYLNADVRYILENLGFSFRKYSTGHGTGDYTFAVPGNVMTDGQSLSLLIYPEWELELGVETGSVNADLPVIFPALGCEKLAKKSREALRNHKPQIDSLVERYNDVGSNLTPVARCIRCHANSETTSGFAPYIPFDDTGMLRAWLHEGDNAKMITYMVTSGKMPQKSSLSEREKASLLEVINLLSN